MKVLSFFTLLTFSVASEDGFLNRFFPALNVPSQVDDKAEQEMIHLKAYVASHTLPTPGKLSFNNVHKKLRTPNTLLLEGLTGDVGAEPKMNFRVIHKTVVAEEHMEEDQPVEVHQIVEGLPEGDSVVSDEHIEEDQPVEVHRIVEGLPEGDSVVSAVHKKKKSALSHLTKIVKGDLMNEKMMDSFQKFLQSYKEPEGSVMKVNIPA